MKNIETPRKKHAGKGIDGGFEKTMEQTMVVVEGRRERKIRRTRRKYLSAVLISRESLRKEPIPLKCYPLPLHTYLASFFLLPKSP